MSLFNLFADLRGVRKELRRIADALDRAVPIPSPDQAGPTEGNDVSYASDESSARQELIDNALRAGYRWIDGELVEPEEEVESQ